MARLIDDLMSLSRIELNEHIAPEGRVDLALAVLDVIDALAPLAAEQGVTLRVRAAGPRRGDDHRRPRPDGAGGAEPDRQRAEVLAARARRSTIEVVGRRRAPRRRWRRAGQAPRGCRC